MRDKSHNDSLLPQIIKYDIIHGKWRLGSKLTISELCTAYPSYTASSIREALIKLLPTGFVNSVSHTGFQVISINYRMYLEFLTLYHIYELQSCILAVDYMTLIPLHILKLHIEKLILIYHTKDTIALPEEKTNLMNSIHCCHPYFKLQEKLFSYQEKLQTISPMLPHEYMKNSDDLEFFSDLYTAYADKDKNKIKSIVLELQKNNLLLFLQFLDAQVSSERHSLSPFFQSFLFGENDSPETILKVAAEYRKIQQNIY